MAHRLNSYAEQLTNQIQGEAAGTDYSDAEWTWRQIVTEDIPALQVLGFTPEEVSEMKLCIDLLEGRNPKEAWDEYAKKFEK